MNQTLLSPGSERAARRLTIGLATMLTAYLFVYALTAPIPRILSSIPDDTAYYLEIAENAAAGRGFTFDGLHATNGFQPLWEWVLVPVFYVFQGSPETMLRVALALQICLLVLAASVMYKTLSPILPPSATLVSAIIFFFFVFVQSVNGMETALLVLGLALLVRLGLHEDTWRRSGWRRPLALGIVLGLTMLARLDTVFLGASVMLLCLIQIVRSAGRRRDALVRMAVVFLGATLVVAPYLSANFLKFGAVAPISAQLKHAFPQLAADTGIFKIPVRALALGAAAGLYLVWTLVRMRSWGRAWSPRHDFNVLLAILALGVVLHLVDTVLYVKWAIFQWHFLSYQFFGALLVLPVAVRALVSFSFLRRGLVFWPGILLLVVLAGYRVHLKHNPAPSNWHTAAYAAAVWARENTPANAVFAMKDAGNFGYFSQRRTINLDGLVNDLALQEALKNGHTIDYLDDHGLDYLVQHAFKDRDDVTSGTYESVVLRYLSYKFDVFGEEITVYRRSEVFRSPLYPRLGSNTLLVVWAWTVGGKSRSSVNKGPE